ncbi:hypothetical protein QVD17_33492 [Tagetes erecta]|uniref:Transmembrane protein n=1 Tax=Tagetes erecta TaxID=13708 RepID=A0AAD8JYV6_TARER|nr:hypothetical protein QVD17_33492 [Tagetes erecta]
MIVVVMVLCTYMVVLKDIDSGCDGGGWKWEDTRRRWWMRIVLHCCRRGWSTMVVVRDRMHMVVVIFKAIFLAFKGKMTKMSFKVK